MPWEESGLGSGPGSDPYPSSASVGMTKPLVCHSEEYNDEKSALGFDFISYLFVLVPVLAEIDPVRIFLLYKPVLFLSSPFFDLLFSGKSSIDVACFLEIDEAVDVVSGGESFYEFVFVFVYSAFQVVCNPYVEDLVVYVRDEVDVEVIILFQRNSLQTGCFFKRDQILPPF